MARPTRRVAIVDDVLTTGATASALALALRDRAWNGLKCGAAPEPPSINRRTLAEANEHIDRVVRENRLLGGCEPRDIANMALYLASDEPRVTTGQILSVDGGAAV